MTYTNSDSFDDQTKAAKDSRDGARDDRAQGRARSRARPRDEHQQRQDLAQPLHGDEQVVAPSKDIETQTAAPLNSEMPAVAPCPSSERQAAPPEKGEELAKTTRSRARRRERGSKNKLCRFCLADIPTAAVRCRHCTSVLNHAKWRRRGGRHISTASRTKEGRRRTAGGPVGPSTDKNSEPKEARSDDQRQRNQRACAQRARLQGQSSRNHRLDSKDRKEASAEAGQPPHGHSAHFTCHATQRPERALGKEARAQQRRRRGGRRGDTRRAAHKAAYEASMAVTPGKDLIPRKEAPPKTRMKTDVKETHGARRIMKDTKGAKAQDARRAAVRALHNILRRAAFRLWREWTEPRAARRARRRLEKFELAVAQQVAEGGAPPWKLVWFDDEFIITEDAGYYYVN